VPGIVFKLKVQYPRAFPAIFASKGAPILGFVFYDKPVIKAV
jgi:hypothetical protein